MTAARRTPGARIRRMILTAALAAALLPGAVVVLLRWVDPPTTSFMLQARLGGLDPAPACAGVAQRWVPWAAMAPAAKRAVMAAEDQRFADHWGFDFAAIRQAVATHARGGDLRGASTITQQVAKNLFLWPGRNLVRKGLEAYLTVWIELAWPKRRILEVYLNVAQFGPCTFGIEAAAAHYFGRSSAELSRRQAARLAAVLPSPATYDAGAPSAYVQERGRWIEQQMRYVALPP